MDNAQRRALWGRALCLAVTAAAIYVVLRRVNLNELSRALRTVHWGWFIAALAIYGFLFVPASWRWHIVLKSARLSVHPGATGRLTLIGHFFYNALFGVIGGDTAKSALYCRWFRLPMPEVLAAAPLDRLLGFAGLLIFAAVAIGFGLAGGAFQSLGKLSLHGPGRSIFLVIPIILAGVLLVSGTRWRKAGIRFATALGMGARVLLKSPRMALSGAACGFVVQAALSGVIALNLRAVCHGDLPWSRLLWTFPLITIFSALPITFAGLGVREGSAMVLFGFYHISNADAVSASLLTLCTSLTWAAIGGALFWRESRRMRAWKEPGSHLSVVIPTLNERAALPETVRRTRLVPEVQEIIVVDGGSTDGTLELAQRLGCQVLAGTGGRGGQMRLGSQHSKGDVIILLHADTWLAEDAGKAILRSLRDPSIVGGGFWKVFREHNLLLAGSRLKCALRFYLGQRVMGDQAMYIRRETLERIGGVPDMPLMEEFELCRRLHKVGRLALADSTVSTSARRFAKLGVARTYVRMWNLTLRYWMGATPQELAHLYDKD